MNDIFWGPYFDRLCGSVNYELSVDDNKYGKLLRYLHLRKFDVDTKGHPLDANRIYDAIDMRNAFYKELDIDKYDDSSSGCSMLEMMVSLAQRCERIIADPDLHEVAPKMFWKMIENLGLKEFTDDKFNKPEAEKIIYKFLTRQYESNGKGGLFYLKDITDDLRTVDIWIQANWYLNSLVEKGNENNG